MNSPCPNATPLYPVGRIALALGIRRQAVAKRLARVQPDGFVKVNGRAAQGWAFGSLPADWRHRLQAIAARRGFRSELHLLDAPPGAWNYSVPLAEVHPEALDKASRLMKALAPVLNRLDDPDTTPEEQATIGLAEYARHFGYAISVRHWRRLLDRTLERDGGAECWDRLEIYLDDRAPCQATPQKKAPESALGTWSELDGMTSGFIDPAAPTAGEMAMFWDLAFTRLEELVAEGIPEVRAKRSLLRYLVAKSPIRSAGQAALRWSLNHKLRRWRAGGRTPAALADMRGEKSGWFRSRPLAEAERLKLLGRIAECGGRVTQGYREMRQAGEFDVETLLHYTQAPRSKSYVPRVHRQQVQTDAQHVDNWMHGPHRAKMAGAYIMRKHDHAAGDWFSADDLTCPVYAWEDEAPRSPCRPQILVQIDTRSLLIMNFVLIMGRSYNGTDVRRLVTLGHDQYGLPRTGFYFERSVWKSHLVTEIGWESVDFSTTAAGFGLLGLRFRHAREARAKVVERILGMLQDKQERDMGYAGRDERHDKYERLDQALRMVRSGKAPAAEFFMHRDELANRFEAICAEYNSTRQQGKIIPGRTPAEAFREFFTEPLVQLDAAQRYLLASYRRRLKVGRNGIALRFHGETFNYKSELTGRLQGQEVYVFFNPESPELLSVSDIQEEIPFTVPRCHEISAMNATPEDLAMAHRQVEAHNGYARRLYRAVRMEFPADFTQQLRRRVSMGDAAEQLGAHMEGQRAAVEIDQAETTGKRSAAMRAAKTLGLPAKAATQPEALDQLTRFLTAHASQNAEPEDAHHGK